VITRSARDGPNVLALRTSSPVVGSSSNANPPDDVASGVEATSIAVFSRIDSPTSRTAVIRVSWVSVSASEVSVVVVLVPCAATHTC
jgi:hypothetical protein